MEDELKCPACRRLYVRPVQLPGCWHSLCRGCAVSRVQTVSAGMVSPSASSLSSLVVGGRRSSLRDDSASVVTTDSSSEHDSSDALSVVSESDSGFVTGSCRPPSCLGASSAAEQTAQTVIACPACSRVVAVDVATLPPTGALDSIVERYREARGLTLDCQLCCGGDPGSADSGGPTPATRMCADCELYLCDGCSHPAVDDDAADHRLTSIPDGRRAIRTRRRAADSKCADHLNESRSLYCLVCRATVCCVCARDGRHVGHHTQPMGAMCKAQKVGWSLYIAVLHCPVV